MLIELKQILILYIHCKTHLNVLQPCLICLTKFIYIEVFRWNLMMFQVIFKGSQTFKQPVGLSKILQKWWVKATPTQVRIQIQICMTIFETADRYIRWNVTPLIHAYTHADIQLQYIRKYTSNLEKTENCTEKGQLPIKCIPLVVARMLDVNEAEVNVLTFSMCALTFKSGIEQSCL